MFLLGALLPKVKSISSTSPPPCYPALCKDRRPCSSALPLTAAEPLAGNSVLGAFGGPGGAPSRPAHLYSPGDDPRVVAHSPEGAAQRHGACLPGTETSQSKWGGDASQSRHPACFPPKSLPNLLSAIRPHPHGASLHCCLTVMWAMTCPSSCRKPG